MGWMSRQRCVHYVGTSCAGGHETMGTTGGEAYSEFVHSILPIVLWVNSRLGSMFALHAVSIYSTGPWQLDTES